MHTLPAVRQPVRFFARTSRSVCGVLQVRPPTLLVELVESHFRDVLAGNVRSLALHQPRDLRRPNCLVDVVLLVRGHTCWQHRRLQYDSWTTMLPDKSTPPQAETDLPLGRARIPANWSLQLVLFLAEHWDRENFGTALESVTDRALRARSSSGVILRSGRAVASQIPKFENWIQNESSVFGAARSGLI